MTWTSTYNADFLKGVVRQLMAIVQRDQRAALDWVGGLNVLPNIQTFQLSMLAIPQFPALLIAPEVSEFDQAAVGSRHSRSKIHAAIAVNNPDPDTVAELVQDYVRALDAIFMTLPLPDFYISLPVSLRVLPEGSTTTPLAVGTVKELFVMDHRYDDIRRVRQSYAMVAVLGLVVDREEA